MACPNAAAHSFALHIWGSYLLIYQQGEYGASGGSSVLISDLSVRMCTLVISFFDFATFGMKKFLLKASRQSTFHRQIVFPARLRKLLSSSPVLMLAKLWQHYVLCLVVCLRHSDSYVCVKTDLFFVFAFLPSCCVQRYFLKSMCPTDPEHDT